MDIFGSGLFEVDGLGSPRRHTRERVVEFTAGDGLTCNLIHLEGDRLPDKGPVLLVHGAGVRANIFRAPVRTTFVDYLIDHGYDVWLENWRASIDLPPSQWTLDQVALYDHPQAVRTVVKETGWEEIKAVIHCQGSTSFMMSAVAGLVPQVKTIVTNAVSLHPVTPWVSQIKMKLLLLLAGPLYPYLNPSWGISAPSLPAKLVSWWVAVTHHECDNPVCKQVSFTYGVGSSTLWRHENLNAATHQWISHEFASVPRSFFRQIALCISRGHLVSVAGKKELPRDFVAGPPQTDARFAFFAGASNRCFLPESQVRSFEYFDAQRKGYHSLHVLPGYGHLDVFLGQNAERDVFPLMLTELEKGH